MKITRIPVVLLKGFFKRVQARRERKRWHRKIERIYKLSAADYKKIPLDIPAYKKRWQKMGYPLNTLWYETYSYISGEANLDYVPEDLYYTVIMPRMNRWEFVGAYSDKNMYEKFITGFPGIFPTVVLRNIEGVFFDRDYRPVEQPAVVLQGVSADVEKIVVKPSLDSGGGKNLGFFWRSGNLFINDKKETLTPAYLAKHYGSNYIIQEGIRQHDYFKRFNKTSLNSVRVMTYRSVETNKIVVLQAALRMGVEGLYSDNLSAGGLSCIVKSDGRLNTFAVDVRGKRFDIHPANAALEFSSVPPLYKFEEMKRVAEEIAGQNHYFRLLGFDFCVDEADRVRIIEINYGGLGINLFQTGGGSLFGKHTDEVINYCTSGKDVK